MNQLSHKIEDLKKSSVKGMVNSRIKEFEALGKKQNNVLFKELCFCILTANCAAHTCINIQQSLGNDFLTLSKTKLAKKLKAVGYRFPNVRANYIFHSRKHKDSLKSLIDSFEDERELRSWLVQNIKGFGLKEASHFLRNIGFKNLAILDFHIIGLLAKHKLIKKPKTLSEKNYLKIEALLEKTAKKLNVTLAELDLYLWFLETGKILK